MALVVTEPDEESQPNSASAELREEQGSHEDASTLSQLVAGDDAAQGYSASQVPLPPMPARPSESNSLRALDQASLEELASALTTQLAKEKERMDKQVEAVRVAEQRLEERRLMVEELERKVLAMSDLVDDVIELNVGGQPMSTTRTVLCSAKGSLLAGMFSGNFDSGHKRDQEGRIFLDVDPPIFAKVLSHLRLRRIASPDCPAPLPHVPEEIRAEYDMVIKFYGLESFMYGEEGSRGNIFEKMAEMAGVEQSRLQETDLVRIALSSTGGVPVSCHQEVLSAQGFHERSLENSYGAHPNTITIRFTKHRVRVDGMELRAKLTDVLAHMSHNWSFRHGNEVCNMSFPFTRQALCTGRLDVPGLSPTFVDEVTWTFPRDFCLEHMVLHGSVSIKK